MKKSKKFILSIIIILVAAVAILLAFPDLFDGEDKEEIVTETTEVQKELEDELFD